MFLLLEGNVVICSISVKSNVCAWVACRPRINFVVEVICYCFDFKQIDLIDKFQFQ